MGQQGAGLLAAGPAGDLPHDYGRTFAAIGNRRNWDAARGDRRATCLTNSMMPMAMAVTMPMHRRIEVDVVRGPVKDTLQPTANHRDTRQHDDIAELPPKVRQLHEPETIA